MDRMEVGEVPRQIVALEMIAAGYWPRVANRTQGASLEKPIEQVLQESSERLMAFSGVVGIAQGLSPSQPHIKVYVVKKTSALIEQIPSEIEGYPVVVEETGEFRKLGPA